MIMGSLAYKLSIVLFLSSVMCHAQEGTKTMQLQRLQIKNKYFKQIMLSNISQSKEDCVFLINFVQRNDTIFTYVGFTSPAFLPELCTSFGNLYIDHSLTGYFSCNKRNCYVFGKSYGSFLRKTNMTTPLPGNLSWIANLSETKSLEDTLLPQKSWTIYGVEARCIDGIYYANGVGYSFYIDSSLEVYAYHKGIFAPLSTFDKYPYSVIEYIENKQ